MISITKIITTFGHWLAGMFGGEGGGGGGGMSDRAIRAMNVSFGRTVAAEIAVLDVTPAAPNSLITRTLMVSLNDGYAAREIAAALETPAALSDRTVRALARALNDRDAAATVAAALAA